MHTTDSARQSCIQSWLTGKDWLQAWNILLFLIVLACLFQSQLSRAQSGGGKSLQPVINGEAAGQGNQPWIVALFRKTPAVVSANRLQFCTGTLIHPYWVLTAAHCVSDVSANDFEVAIGLENLESAFVARQAVSEIISHPGFSFNTLQNDIALLRLETPSENEVIPLGEKDFLNTKARILGWGLSIQDDSECEIVAFNGEVDLENFFCEKFEYSTSNLPSNLLETELNFVSYTACANRINASISERGFDDSYFITAEDINESLYCAWDFDFNSAPCHGDSGGPLIQTINGKMVQIGITSFGTERNCANENAAHLFTNTAHYEAFIENSLGRSRALGFSVYCPGKVELSINVSDFSSTKKLLQLSWDVLEEADFYRLRYGLYPEINGFIRSIDIPAAISSAQVKLITGSAYYVSMQAYGPACNGPISNTRIVKAQ